MVRRARFLFWMVVPVTDFQPAVTILLPIKLFRGCPYSRMRNLSLRSESDRGMNYMNRRKVVVRVANGAVASAFCSTAFRDSREARLVGSNPPGQASETPPYAATMGLAFVVAVAESRPVVAAREWRVKV
jgi:hypothetical protein